MFFFGGAAGEAEVLRQFFSVLFYGNEEILACFVYKFEWFGEPEARHVWGSRDYLLDGCFELHKNRLVYVFAFP